MRYLKEKSDQNLKASSTLLAHSLSAASVHCSYYSCVLLMLHILRSDLAKTEEEVEAESEAGSRNDKGFHNWLCNLIARELLLSKRDASVGREFNSSIGTLKRLRIQADYKNVEIKLNKAKDGLSLAKDIIKLLEGKFTV